MELVALVVALCVLGWARVRHRGQGEARFLARERALARDGIPWNHPAHQLPRAHTSHRPAYEAGEGAEPMTTMRDGIREHLTSLSRWSCPKGATANSGQEIVTPPMTETTPIRILVTLDGSEQGGIVLPWPASPIGLRTVPYRESGITTGLISGSSKAGIRPRTSR